MIGKVLIVDDVSTNRIVFKVKLSAAGYEVILAADAAGCLAAARAETPDLILLDYGLSDLPATDVLAKLRQDPRTRHIPVVVFSAEGDPERRLAALSAGADDFLLRPIDDQTLLARLRNLLRAQAETGDAELAGLAEGPMPFEGPGLVAIVSNRPDRAQRLERDLAAVARNRFVHVTGEEVFADDVRPDVYLIDADLNGPGSGLRMMSELLSRPASRHAACLMLYDRIPLFAAAIAYDLGAHDLADAQVTPAELELRLARLVRRKREADCTRAKVQDGLRLAIRDPLTGLHNRRYAMSQLQALARQASQQQAALAVMLVDLDRFKSVNDRFGHAAGDAVLIEVAGRLAACVGSGDLLARVGGEEFLIALPEAGLERAGAMAVRICDAIKERLFVLPSGQAIDLTASIGVTIAAAEEAEQALGGMQAVIDRADGALMTAKNAGRDRITVGRSAA